MRKFRASLELFCDLKSIRVCIVSNACMYPANTFNIAKLHAIFSEVWLVELLGLCNP